jgi:hypothetical protein
MDGTPHPENDPVGTSNVTISVRMGPPGNFQARPMCVRSRTALWLRQAYSSVTQDSTFWPWHHRGRFFVRCRTADPMDLAVGRESRLAGGWRVDGFQVCAAQMLYRSRQDASRRGGTSLHTLNTQIPRCSCRSYPRLISETRESPFLKRTPESGDMTVAFVTGITMVADRRTACRVRLAVTRWPPGAAFAGNPCCRKFVSR